MNRSGSKWMLGLSFAVVAVVALVAMAYAGSETKAVEGKQGACCPRMGAVSKGDDAACSMAKGSASKGGDAVCSMAKGSASKCSESKACASKGGGEACPMAASCQGCASAKVTVTGENVCVSCSLKKEKGAAAQCKVYGHRHGLRVAKMECGGHQAGKCGYSTGLLHYLENDQSKELIQGNHGKQVEVTGTLYGPESVVQVDSFRVLEAAGSETR